MPNPTPAHAWRLARLAVDHGWRLNIALGPDRDHIGLTATSMPAAAHGTAHRITAEWALVDGRSWRYVDGNHREPDGRQHYGTRLRYLVAVITNTERKDTRNLWPG